MDEKEPTSDEMIPPVFISRKNKILADLSTPADEYSDLSPKGSVDEGIQDLIQDINTLPGLVTTSSCAGRISVFLEGRRVPNPSEEIPESRASEQRKFVPSGGKGAGKWLYVSHELLNMDSSSENKEEKPLHEMFGMTPGDGKPPGIEKSQGHAPRLVRFHFEPLILHIMTATLHHAQPVLSAASSSGFRESGLQGLRCLEGDSGPSPIVAVRSAGLALESIIGYCEDGGDEPVIRSLVSEEYLRMLVNMSNERFSVNSERRERFRTAILDGCSIRNSSNTKSKGKMRPPGWEDPETRKERKRAEGLMRKKLLEGQAAQDNDQNANNEDEVGIWHSLDTEAL